MTRLLLCRHAEAGSNEQTASLAAELERARPVAVYTSPLPRAVDTAAAVAGRHGLSPIEVDELREIDLGEAEGVPFDDLPAMLRNGLLRRPATVRFPGGESFDELQQRVCAALTDIVSAHPAATVVVISHAGAIRAALARWLSMPGDASFRLDQRHAALNVVDWNKGVPFVRLVNGTALG